MRSAVVTGAASGIGRALATLLADVGAELTLADRDSHGLNLVAKPLSARTLVMDVARVVDNERLVALSGAADLVCLNAGITGTVAGPVWTTPPEEWQRVLDVNLGGVINGLRAYVPELLATGRRHRILITASLAGLATWAGGGAYAASKHAALAVAEQAALALDDTPVSVTVLCPALVRTGMSEVGADPLDVAAEALEAAERGDFVVMPAEWTTAVVCRAERLTARLPPISPVAEPSAGDSE